MPRRDDGVDLGIDTTPRGPARRRGGGPGGFLPWLAAVVPAGPGRGALERALGTNPIRTREQADAEAAREWPRIKAEAEKARADVEARRPAGPRD